VTRTRDAVAVDRPPQAARRARVRARRPRHGARARRPLALLLAGCTALAGTAALAGCTADAEPTPAPEPEQASPFADCAALTAPPPSAAPVSAPVASAGSSAATLPRIQLPCFTGGQPVRLSDLRGPAVVNMWASWCEPCRDELPIMQRLADRADGRVHVLGVDTGDGRDAAASFGAAKQVRMPTLYDRDRKLLTAIGRINLPVTIFVDSAGRHYVHALPVDAYELSALVRQHTGVTVAP
jgi:thiol-disulfide isomerase/thioredoxin